MLTFNIICFNLSCFIAFYIALIGLSYESILLTLFNMGYFIYINYKS